MRVRLSVAVALAAVLGVAALLAPLASAEASAPAYGSRLVSLINAARVQHGLPALTVVSGTSTVASNWTSHLAAAQTLSHNPDLGSQLQSHGSADWTAYGENVGDGPSSSADALFDAYMNSPEHRSNILGSSYRYLGVGVVFSGSTAWNTLDFVDQYSTSRPRAATPQAPHQQSAPRPAPHPQVARQVRAVRHGRAIAARPAMRRATPRPRPVQVRAVMSAVPVAPVAAAAVVPVAAALPAPLRLPVDTRNPPAVVAAAAAILLVVATRFVVEVFPRGA